MGGGLMGMVRSGYYDCIIDLKQPMYNAFPTDKNEHIRMILSVINDDIYIIFNTNIIYTHFKKFINICKYF